MVVNRWFRGFLIVALGACGGGDGPRFEVGGADAKIYGDARVYKDAPPHGDASPPPDAFVPQDGPPPPPARACTNKGDSITNGQETLKLAITCSVPADQGRAIHATITGGSGSNATTFDFLFALDCASTVGVPVNNFLMFAATQDLHAMSVSASLFDLPCN